MNTKPMNACSTLTMVLSHILIQFMTLKNLKNIFTEEAGWTLNILLNTQGLEKQFMDTKAAIKFFLRGRH